MRLKRALGVSADASSSEVRRTSLNHGFMQALLQTSQMLGINMLCFLCLKELAEAQRLFTKLESSERKFQLLVHYGLGRVYLKENR